MKFKFNPFLKCIIMISNLNLFTSLDISNVNNPSIHVFSILVARTVDSGASNAKVDSKGMHAVINCNYIWMQYKLLWIKASTKCINNTLNNNVNCLVFPHEMTDLSLGTYTGLLESIYLLKPQTFLTSNCHSGLSVPTPHFFSHNLLH